MLGGGKKVAVGIAAPSLLCQPLPGGRQDQVLFLNNGTVPVFVGDGQVTSAYGYPVEPLGTLTLPGDSSWYGIADPTAGAVRQVVNVIPGALGATPSAAQIALQIRQSASSLLATFAYDQAVHGISVGYPLAGQPLIDVSNYQSIGVLLTDPGGVPATGHVRVTLNWVANNTTISNDQFFKTAGLSSRHAVPIQAPYFYLIVDGNVGSKVNVSMIGYNRPVPATEPLQNGFLSIGLQALAANTNGPLTIPAYDGYGPATVWVAGAGLTSGVAVVQQSDYDHNDNLVSVVGNFAVSGPNGHQPAGPQQTWLSRYRHKFQPINLSGVAINLLWTVTPNG